MSKGREGSGLEEGKEVGSRKGKMWVEEGEERREGMATGRKGEG